MATKSADAFRTISEAAEQLDLPQHVLRHWEDVFGHIRPMRRAGGRRYYRTYDLELLNGVRTLLYDERYTTKGVQKIFKENGPQYVAEIGRRAKAGEVTPTVAREGDDETGEMEKLSITPPATGPASGKEPVTNAPKAISEADEEVAPDLSRQAEGSAAEQVSEETTLESAASTVVEMPADLADKLQGIVNRLDGVQKNIDEAVGVIDDIAAQFEKE